MAFLKFLCLIVIIVIVIVCDGRSEPTTSRYVYNSSDLSYLSNGIQFPAPENDIATLLPGEVGVRTLPELKWLSELYDHHRWEKFARALNNTRCRDDLITYIKELYNGTSWATKMYDASGRYIGQFFFGNDYWLGSLSLCEELTNNETNLEIPPFPIRFSVSKLRININRQITPVTRQINLGECLPKSCSTLDVRLLLAQEPKQGATINIVDVRTVPGDYNLLDDVKFVIICGVSLVLTVIIVIASLLEYITRQQIKKEKDNAEAENNNNNNNNTEDTKGSKEMVIGKNPKKLFTKNPFVRIILCFSAINNGRKILNVQSAAKNAITCIHGMRFFSILWIILVHTYLEIFGIGGNKNMRIVTERSFMYQTISNATFSVDTFFFISGLLVTITYFRSEQRKEKPLKEQHCCQTFKASFFKFLLMMVYRFFRLTPAYLFVLGVNELILRYLHSYSVFSPAIIDHISCDNYWWRNALYINNFFPQAEFCMLWSWYIANDTQFYLIASIILLIAIRGERFIKFAGATIGVFLISSWVTTFIIAMKYEYVARVEEPFALFDQLYDKPWLRIGPYLVGMVSGYFLFKINCQMKINPIVVIIGWILSLSCLMSLVYGLGRSGLVVPASAFYASLGHTAWGVSLAWITLACCTGYGGPINAIFSCKLLLPLSRLTYCAYLIHPVLMCLTSFILDGTLHLHNVFVMVIFCGNVVISFLSAFVISLAFEAPVVNLLKVIF